uniref:Macrophage migration inhibitory factor n=1 Tax=Panagrolaimus sp. PS1159 TaxID=55785 RepID=A0AC35F2M6_9BILA
MPIVKLYTNHKVTENFAKDFTTFLSTTLNKPNSSIFIIIKDQEKLTVGGESDDRIVVLELKAVGIINNTSNVGFSQAITNYLTQAIDVKPEKVIIDFALLDPGFVGKSGTTVEEMQKSKQ